MRSKALSAGEKGRNVTPRTRLTLFARRFDLIFISSGSPRRAVLITLSVPNESLRFIYFPFGPPVLARVDRFLTLLCRAKSSPRCVYHSHSTSARRRAAKLINESALNANAKLNSHLERHQFALAPWQFLSLRIADGRVSSAAAPPR